MDQNWNSNQSGSNGQMGPSMPPVPNAGMNVAPMLTPQMAGAGAVPVNPMAPPVPDSGKKSSVIETIILVFVCLIAAAAIVFAVMFYMQYNDLQADYDSKLASEVAAAEKNQKEIDEKDFMDREKLPNYSFTGPSDYGSISFQYPKTWSVYIHSDGTQNSDFEAYFSPKFVNPIDDEKSRYALRFIIRNEPSDEVMREYNTKVLDGDMTSKIFNADRNRISGNIYEGTIEEGMVGIVFVFKVNNMTGILRTDAETFRKDFEALVETLRRNN
jgi:hypothetical protein